MKRVIIAIVFIVLSFMIGIYSANETNERCDKMVARIETAIKLNIEISEKSSHYKRIEFYNSMKNLNQLWEENSKFFYIFFNNDEIRDIEINIEKLPTHAKCGDIESAYLCLIEVLEGLEYLENSSKLDFENVF